VTSGRTYKQVGSAARLSCCGGRFDSGGSPSGGSGKHPAVGFCASAGGPALWGWFARTAIPGCTHEGTRQDVYPAPSTGGSADPAQPSMTLTRRGSPCKRLCCRTPAPSRNPAAARTATEAARVRIANRPCRFISTMCERDHGRLRSAQSRRFAATATCDFHSYPAADAFRPVPRASRWVDRSRTTDDP
jgi:hypothetical protein